MKEYITKENKAKLEAELKELTGPRRKEIIAALEYAKSLGDLSENAEYHSAREAQGQLQERISTIEYVLNHAVVMDRVTDGVVNIGSTVVIQKDGEPNTRTFIIVGSEETDMLSGKISYKSPIGSALYGKKKGDTVTVTTPKGEMDYQIVSVE
ncbi:MAG: grea/greb family elongation factor, transcription elongation factor GreA [Candidatus Nomurabacteria bacterium]|jgi:transcription elongation factor GreA|nr:grea/greb family elongation factor, transcription elongation factor GreA [Candidatus Nomurabacteria bacterium]